jgi:hypothetical protein
MGSDSGTPLPLNCPKCGGKLIFHNSRTEPDPGGEPETIQVYLCVQHGFFRYTEREALKPGM